MSLLEVRNIRREFGGVLAVADVSFAVQRGEIVALIGPNGAGKTTTFNLIAGVHRLSGGVIRFKGRTINGLRLHQVAALGLARTFQNLQIFNNMSALENVMTGRHLRSHYGLIGAARRLPHAGREERAIREHACACLSQVGLAERAAAPAAGLSFGQQRLLEIARAGL